MEPDQFAALFPLVVVVVGVGVAVAVNAYGRKRWRATAAALVDVEDASTFFTRALRTKPPLRAGDIAAVGGGKNNPPRWRVTTTSAVAERTTLTLSREGGLGKLRERVGWKDVHVGDAAFDAFFTVRGSEPDVVRGVLASADVRFAARELFDVSLAESFSIGADGRATAGFRRPSTSPDEARVHLVAVVRFVELLDRHANANPRADVELRAVAAESGAPVSVPTA